MAQEQDLRVEHDALQGNPLPTALGQGLCEVQKRTHEKQQQQQLLQ
jgi:hypothetical protein